MRWFDFDIALKDCKCCVSVVAEEEQVSFSKASAIEHDQASCSEKLQQDMNNLVHA